MPSSKVPAASPQVSTREGESQWRRGGPILYFRGFQDDRVELAAVLVGPSREPPPEVRVGEAVLDPEVLCECDDLVVLRYILFLPASTGGTYHVADESFDVAGISDGDLRVAYVSCNGQEHGDRERSLDERNAMWRRLARQHAAEPLNLVLHGGDQLYADEMLDVHPAVRAWGDGTIADSAALPLEEVRARLRTFLMNSYLELYRQPAPAWLLARVPSLCMWDDHDICDGWGSLSAERMDAAIGKTLFQAAREFFLLFQLGSSVGVPPPICPDRTGTTLTWAARLPGVLLIAPDLRSERRPQRVLGPAGWKALRASLNEAGGEPVFLISSVPVLGPRLSWVEAVLHLVPGAQKYEDDLRDQWQSRAHRDEWRRLLGELLTVHDQGRSQVTILSGEIHLATRCTMAASGSPLHQLVASGITHPAPPRWYGRVLGALAMLGESPLPDHPIRLHPLPGKRSIYTCQRNYLMLERRDGRWTARWELERDGPTPPLEL